MKIPPVIKWVGVALGTCISIGGKILDIKEIIALGLSGDVWLLIGFVILAFSLASLVYRMQKEQESLHARVQGITIPPTTTTTPPPTMDETRMTYIQNRDIYISDLVRHEDKISARVFENCLIIGPAIITFIGCDARDSGFEGDLESLFIEVPERRILGAIAFENCLFRNCHFRRVGIIGTPDLIQYLRGALVPRT
jgi:hypothetical protein